MSSPFVAEIRVWGFNFAPSGWAQCAGQLLPISQNTALFSLLGTTYGGDGKSNFALPDLQGRAPVSSGTSTTGTEYDLGEQGGSSFITLIQSEIPVHTHNVMTQALDPGDLPGPDPTHAVSKSANGSVYNSSPGNLVQMNVQSISVAGGSSPHNNMMGYLTLNFCIALQGVFPQRP